MIDGPGLIAALHLHLHRSRFKFTHWGRARSAARRRGRSCASSLFASAANLRMPSASLSDAISSAFSHHRYSASLSAPAPDSHGAAVTEQNTDLRGTHEHHARVTKAIICINYYVLIVLTIIPAYRVPKLTYCIGNTYYYLFYLFIVLLYTEYILV